MNQKAYEAIEEVWTLTVKARALCPYCDQSAIGMRGYCSPGWYQVRGAVYFVNLAEPLTDLDVRELKQIGAFLNRSFVIAMASILETSGVVPYRDEPDRGMPGGDHVQLTKWLRNRFAHGEWVYDANKSKHVETWELLERLFPVGVAGGPGFITSIDTILEPLKDGVISYIRATP